MLADADVAGEEEREFVVDCPQPLASAIARPPTAIMFMIFMGAPICSGS